MNKQKDTNKLKKIRNSVFLIFLPMHISEDRTQSATCKVRGIISNPEGNREIGKINIEYELIGK